MANPLTDLGRIQYAIFTLVAALDETEEPVGTRTVLLQLARRLDAVEFMQLTDEDLRAIEIRTNSK